jgi:hypothetical protein
MVKPSLGLKSSVPAMLGAPVFSGYGHKWTTFAAFDVRERKRVQRKAA